MGKIIDLLSGQKVLEERKSRFNGEVKVIKNLTFGTHLQAGGITQSGGVVKGIWKSTLKEIKKKNKKIKNCLILGLGGGTLAGLITKEYPKTKITGVDIDPVMVRLGKKYLGLKGVKVEIADAYDWVIKNRGRDFDLVIIDIYQGREFPKKFEEEKFLKLLMRMLRENGLIIFNRLYYGEKRKEAVKFGKKLESIFPKVEYFYPEANLMFICYE
jgi:spermidine synthase